MQNLLETWLDIDPPPLFATEMVTCLEPRTFWVCAYALPDLFAGKVSAALFRKWKNRVKGRDWYDVLWYVMNGGEIDLDICSRDFFHQMVLKMQFTTPE